MLTFYVRFFILATISLFSVAGFAGDLKVTLLRDLNNDQHFIARIEDGRLCSINLRQLATRDDLSAKEREIIRGASLKNLDKVNLNNIGVLTLTDASQELSIIELLDLLDRGETTLSSHEYSYKESFEWESDYPPKKIGIKCNNESFLPITQSLAEVSPILFQTLSPVPEELPSVADEPRIQIRLPEKFLKKAEASKTRHWKTLTEVDLNVFSRFDLKTVGRGLTGPTLADRLGIHFTEVNEAIRKLKLQVGETCRFFDQSDVERILKNLHQKAESIQSNKRNLPVQPKLPIVRKSLTEIDLSVFDQFDFQKVGKKGITISKLADELRINSGTVSSACSDIPEISYSMEVPEGGNKLVKLFDKTAVETILERLKKKAEKAKEQHKAALAALTANKK